MTHPIAPSLACLLVCAGSGSPQPYWLMTESQEVTVNGVPQIVHDLYALAFIPAPGAAALFALAGMTAAHRRRG